MIDVNCQNHFKTQISRCHSYPSVRRGNVPNAVLATFRLEYEDDYEYEFKVLSSEHAHFNTFRPSNLNTELVLSMVNSYS